MEHHPRARRRAAFWAHQFPDRARAPPRGHHRQARALRGGRDPAVIDRERPETSDEGDGTGFAPGTAAPRTPRTFRLTPTGYDYATIGAFYQAIEADLRALAGAIGEAALFCGDPALQLTAAEVELKGARPVTGLDSALAALAEIIVEGEGAPSDSDESHFRRFVAVRDEMRALGAANPGFAPAHPVATNPVLRKPPSPEGRVWIDDPEAIAAVDLANAIYVLALRLLAGACALPRPNPDKALLVGSAIGLMHALTAIAERAARLPAGPSNPGCNAGVSFTALREVNPAPVRAPFSSSALASCRPPPRRWTRMIRAASALRRYSKSR